MDEAARERPRDPHSFGAWLRRSRELRGLSLDEVIVASRLPKGVVAALEADDTGAMPDRAYALQFTRAVALCVGLDPEDAALRYEEWLALLPPATLPPPPRVAETRAGRLWARTRSIARAPLRVSRDPLVWGVLAATAIAIAAMLLRR